MGGGSQGGVGAGERGGVGAGERGGVGVREVRGRARCGGAPPLPAPHLSSRACAEHEHVDAFDAAAIREGDGAIRMQLCDRRALVHCRPSPARPPPLLLLLLLGLQVFWLPSARAEVDTARGGKVGEGGRWRSDAFPSSAPHRTAPPPTHPSPPSPAHPPPPPHTHLAAPPAASSMAISVPEEAAPSSTTCLLA